MCCGCVLVMRLADRVVWYLVCLHFLCQTFAFSNKGFVRWMRETSTCWRDQVVASTAIPTRGESTNRSSADLTSNNMQWHLGYGGFVRVFRSWRSFSARALDSTSNKAFPEVVGIMRVHQWLVEEMWLAVGCSIG
ncbi:hypothetical protein GE09DRAFT_4694 [Coniochaeta sp. 2T2.1]|nr:hypothetical protein GE09DRAFT_4694 [Coniochaeta sp. 2T2.1]